MIDHLFLYGSLRPRAASQLPEDAREFSAALHQRLRPLGPATVQGRLYRLAGWFPGLRPSDQASDQVHGEVFAFGDVDILRDLDAFEETDTGLYQRRQVQARLDAGGSVPVWAYFYGAEPDGARVPSGDFLEALAQP